MGLILPSKSSLPKIAVSDLQGYTEDRVTAIAFELPFQWRWILIIVLVFGGGALGILLYFAGLPEKLYAGVMTGGSASGIIFGLIHVRLLSHSRPISLRSHEKMTMYWRSDSPPCIIRQPYMSAKRAKHILRGLTSFWEAPFSSRAAENGSGCGY
jgi:hypothetical protein